MFREPVGAKRGAFLVFISYPSSCSAAKQKLNLIILDGELSTSGKLGEGKREGMFLPQLLQCGEAGSLTSEVLVQY